MQFFKKKKLKKYLVFSTNHDKLMIGELTPCTCVYAANDKEMYALLERMEPINPNEFLIFEEILC
jgi:hypothetical protein